MVVILSIAKNPRILPRLLRFGWIPGKPLSCPPERRDSRRESRSRRTCGLLALPLLVAPFFLCAALLAQTPADPATHTFHDPTYHLSFDYPANWNFSHTDREISTFHLDARSASKNAIVRAVVAMPENPFPASTFSGAYVYFSVAPHTSATACAQQAAATPSGKPTRPATIADISFAHGHDQQKDVCITQRDEIYTTRRRGACYRFDLAINNFCSESSGVKDISPSELDQVNARLEAILNTIRFDPK